MALNISVDLEIRSETVRKAMQEFAAAEQNIQLRDADSPGVAHILILELDAADPPATFSRIDGCTKTAPSTEIFLTGADVDQQVLIEALRAGVKEFLTQPLEPGEVKKAFERCRERLGDEGAAGKHPASIISVVGGKAGVGVTTVVVNLAASLQRLDSGKSVAVMDLNLRGGEIAAFLDVNPLRNLQDLDSDLSRLDDTFLASILTRHNSGLYVMPLGEMDLSGGHVTPDCVSQTLSLMRSMFDYVCVDCGHVVDPVAQTAIDMSNTVLVVSTLTVPVVRRTKRVLDRLEPSDQKKKEVPVHLMMNKYTKKDEALIDDVENMLGVSPFWQLPADHALTERAINDGMPLMTLAPKKELSRSYMKLAETLAPGSGGGKKGSFLADIFKLVSEKLARGTPSPSLAG